MNRKLSKKQFEEVAQGFDWASDNKLAAKKVLVDGISIAAVASHFKKSRQRINILVKQVWDAYVDKMGVPEDWEIITVALPKKEAKRTLELSVKLREEIITKAVLEKK